MPGDFDGVGEGVFFYHGGTEARRRRFGFGVGDGGVWELWCVFNNFLGSFREFYFFFSELLEGAEGAIIGPFEAGFMGVEGGEFGEARLVDETFGELGVRAVGRGVLIEPALEFSGMDDADAVDAPLGYDHAVDEVDFDDVPRQETVSVELVESAELFGIFVVKDDAAGERRGEWATRRRDDLIFSGHGASFCSESSARGFGVSKPDGLSG